MVKIPLPELRWKKGSRYGKPFTVKVPSMHGPWYPSRETIVYCESKSDADKYQSDINAIYGVK